MLPHLKQGLAEPPSIKMSAPSLSTLFDEDPDDVSHLMYCIYNLRLRYKKLENDPSFTHSLKDIMLLFDQLKTSWTLYNNRVVLLDEEEGSLSYKTNTLIKYCKDRRMQITILNEETKLCKNNQETEEENTDSNDEEEMFILNTIYTHPEAHKNFMRLLAWLENKMEIFTIIENMERKVIRAKTGGKIRHHRRGNSDI